MSSGTKLAGLVGIVAVIIGASVWLGRQTGHAPAVVESTPTSSGTAAPAHEQVTKTGRVQFTNKPVTEGIEPKPSVTPSASPQSTTNELIADWNEKIDEVLKGPGDERETAKSLLKLFPKFPAEGQVEAVQHISNLLPDEDYPELGKLMEDAKLPEEVLDQLIMDLLNRPHKVMLPELLQVAKIPQHPKASEAKDFLELYLEEDYGTDWTLWQSKLDEWLKANPE